MARHAKDVDRRIRAIRISTVAFVWLAGLAAGFVGVLAAVARYGCGVNDHGLACRKSGSIVGVVIVAAVIAIVAAVTIVTRDRPARRVLIVGGIAVIALAICFAAAQSLRATV